MSTLEQLQGHLRLLRLPTAAAIIADLLTTAGRDNWPLENFLKELLEQELEGRHRRRIDRLQRSSRLPLGKTLATLQQDLLPCACVAN